MSTTTATACLTIVDGAFLNPGKEPLEVWKKEINFDTTPSIGTPLLPFNGIAWQLIIESAMYDNNGTYYLDLGGIAVYRSGFDEFMAFLGRSVILKKIEYAEWDTKRYGSLHSRLRESGWERVL